MGHEWCQHPLYFGTQEFQDPHFEFCADEEGEETMFGVDRPGWSTRLEQQNSQMSSGSRFVCREGSLINFDSSPGCFSESYHYREPVQWWCAKNDVGILVARRKGTSLYTKVNVRHNYNDKERKAHVSLEGIKNWHMCLDRAHSSDLYYYINSRKERGRYID